MVETMLAISAETGPEAEIAIRLADEGVPLCVIARADSDRQSRHTGKDGNLRYASDARAMLVPRRSP
jgi:hypothetical protein